MSNPFFSIVIPTYNRGEFIEETLKSTLSQTYSNYEIIVIDDCSTDNTVEILQPYINQNKIRFFKNEQNSERSYSRNVGIKNAKGDFITFLDSDDFMYETCLSDAANFTQENPGYKCFQNLYELVDRSKTPIRQYSFPPLDNQLSSIVNGNFVSCIGNFIHREIYTKYHFDTFRDLSGIEDWDFWLRVLADYKLGRIEKVNNGIYQHDNRSVNTGSLEKLNIGCEYLIKKFHEDEHLSKVYAKYLKRLEASLYFYLAILANTSGFHKEGRKHIRRALKKDFSTLFTIKFLKILRRNVF